MTSNSAPDTADPASTRPANPDPARPDPTRPQVARPELDAGLDAYIRGKWDVMGRKVDAIEPMQAGGLEIRWRTGGRGRPSSTQLSGLEVERLQGVVDALGHHDEVGSPGMGG